MTAAAKRDFLAIADLTRDEAVSLIALARALKAEPKDARISSLAGRAVAVILEKASTRTRVSFEVGIASLGAQPVVITQGSQLGRGEPVKDTARVLARYCDAIVFRTSTTDRLREMAQATVPVINALSDDGHPVQVMSDVMTVEEQLGPIAGKRVAFIGDCSSNMARSWLEAAKLLDFHLVLAGPEAYRPPRAELERARGSFTLVSDPKEAATACDVINTDVWTSMGQEAENAARLAAFRGWSVDASLLLNAPAHGIVLHCLPAHRGEEIDDATLEGPRSRVWDQAENRLHLQKALLLWLLNAQGA